MAGRYRGSSLQPGYRTLFAVLVDWLIGVLA
jgi:hypothetical protein